MDPDLPGDAGSDPHRPGPGMGHRHSGQRPRRYPDGKPAKVSGLSVSATQGSLSVPVDWDDVASADDYLVRWRLHGPGQDLNDGVRPTSSDTTITVADYGGWVVRVQACNTVGCGGPVTKTFEVEPAPEPTATPTPTPEPTPTPSPTLDRRRNPRPRRRLLQRPPPRPTRCGSAFRPAPRSFPRGNRSP